MEDPKPDIASTGSSNKVTRLRGRSLPDTCKLVYGKALELSKYDHFENGSVMKKGHIFVGKKSIPLEEYRKHVNNLLDVFDQLGIQYATSVSQYLRKQYPESDKVVQKLKSFYAQLEAKISTPLKSAEETEVQSQVFMFDASTKFQTMEAVFTGKDIEEAYDDDRFQLQCEEIEILLSGGQRTRDVGQEEEIKQLTQLLQGLERNGGISGPVHRQSRPGQTALNTARTGPTVPNTARTMGPGSFPSAHNLAFDPARVGPGVHYPSMAAASHEHPPSARVPNPNVEALLPPSSLTKAES
eukprot:EG_transcript_14540